VRFLGWDISVQRKALSIVSSQPVGSAFWGWLREPFAGAWQGGATPDNQESLLAFSAVYACVSRIASDIAKLRVRLVSTDTNGIWTEVAGFSPFWGPLVKPNSYQTRIQFLTSWLISKLLYGNTFVLKVRNDARGMVTEMHVLHPRLVTPLLASDGSVYYRLSADVLAEKPLGDTVPASEIIHDRGMTLFHPLVGVSPIYACGLAATQGKRIQTNSMRFFENMSRPSGMLSAPNTIDDQTAARLKREWEENFSADRIGRLAVLGDGLKYEAMMINAVDAQLIEQLKWSGEDVARAFGVPGYKIGVGPTPALSNVEALEQQYYTGTLQLLIESIEVLLDEGLETPTGMGTEFDLDGLLRMDTATMYDSLGKLVNTGIMAPNEARNRVNLAPTAGGDTPYMQQQNWSLAQLDRRDIVADKPSVAAPPAAAEPGAPEPAAAPAAPAAPAAGKELVEGIERVHTLMDTLTGRLDDLVGAVRAAPVPAGEDDELPVDEPTWALCRLGLQASFKETLYAPR
jgi:HK97 family phage portal protein